MPFFGDALGSYMVPRLVLELLQQPDGQPQAGICADSCYAWVLAGASLYVWRYQEGKDARLRALGLPRPPSPAGPCFVSLIPHNAPASAAAAAAQAASASGAGLSPAFRPAAAEGPLSVAVCDADGHLTVWLDAHHLASPVQHQLLTSAGQRPGQGQGQARGRALVAAFSAARLDQGAGAAFLAALSASDGSLHLIQVGAQGIFPKQLAAPAPPPAAAARAPAASLASTASHLVTALGGALSRAVTDAFDASARYLRRGPAGRPCVGLCLQPAPGGGGGGAFRLLALSEEALDCWAISVGLRPSETLQWSFLNTRLRTHDAGRGAGAVTAAANMALAAAPAGGSRVAVWLSERVRGEPAPQHVLQLLDLLPDGGPAVVACGGEALEGYLEPPEEAAAQPPPERRLLYSPATHTCLLGRWRADPRVCRALWAWHAATGAAARLSEDPDTAAVGAATAAVPPRWVVLSATYGVVEVSAAPPGAAPPEAAPAAAAGGGLDPTAAIVHLLDAVLSQAGAIAAAGGNLLPLVSGLERRLNGLGALGSAAGQATIAAYSTQLIDQLPKQWAGGAGGAGGYQGGGGEGGMGLAAAGGGGGALAAVSVGEALAEKEARHGLLLRVMALSGVLHALAPEVQSVLLENSEKLAVAAALHRLAQQQRDAGAAALEGTERGGPHAGAHTAAALLARLVGAAGAESAVREYEVLSPQEIFFSRPSVSVGRWVAALGRAAAEVAAQAAGGLGHPGDRDLPSLRATARELGALVGCAWAAALGRREAAAAAHHVAAAAVAARLGRPDWLADTHTRAALLDLTQAVQAVRPRRTSSDAADEYEDLSLSPTLLGVSDVLLSAFAAAVAATAADPPTRGSLLSQYRSARSGCAEALLRDALVEMRGGAAAGHAGPPPPEALIWQVEALCRAHHCYPQLFAACEALATADPRVGPSCLHTHMATLGPEPGAPPSDPAFAAWVFGALLEGGRHADLLELPTQFTEGVTSFLQSRQPAAAPLLALHLLRTGQYGGAAGALLASVAASAAAGGQGGGGGAQGGPLGGPPRLLALARLAAVAGGEARLGEAAALQLRLLGLQARLGLPASGAPLDPAVLLERALAAATARLGTPTDTTDSAAAAKAAAVAAVEVLALMPPAARSAHASKWQVAWKAAYDADPWDAIAEARRRRGPGGGGDSAGDEEAAWAARLAGSGVCLAAAACGGSDALGCGASVVDSAPLDQVARWLRSWAVAVPAGGGGGAKGGEARVEAVMAALQMGLDGRAGGGGGGGGEQAAAMAAGAGVVEVEAADVLMAD